MADPTNDYVDQYLPLIRHLENSGDSAVSNMGAIGRYQIMPATGRAYGYTPDDLRDPEKNEQAARSVLRDLVKKYGNDPRAVLVGYNASTATRQRWEANGRDDSVLPVQTQRYLAGAGLMTQPKPAEPSRIAPGLASYQKMLDGGVPQNEADAWRQRQNQRMIEGGVPIDQIKDYWGGDVPQQQTKKVIENNISQATAPQYQSSGLSDAGITSTQPEKEKVSNPWQGWEYGMQMSASGVTLRNGAPDRVMPKDAGLWTQITAGLGQMVGDAPFYVAGAGAGAMLTGETGPGAVVGAAVGASAFPSAVRNIFMDEYEHPAGSKTPQEVLGRIGNVTMNTVKDTAAGTVGQLVGGKVGAAIAKPMFAKAAELTSMAMAQTAASSAMAGQVPSPNEIIAGTITAVGIHAAGKLVGATRRFVPNDGGAEVQKTFGEIYRETGMRPKDVAVIANGDPAAKAELLTSMPDGSIETPLFKTHEKAEAGAMADEDADRLRMAFANQGRAEQDFLNAHKDIGEGQRAALNFTPDRGNGKLPADAFDDLLAQNHQATTGIYEDRVLDNQLKALGEPDPIMPDSVSAVFRAGEVYNGFSYVDMAERPAKQAADQIADYLWKFGKQAGFHFMTAPAETVMAGKNTPAYLELHNTQTGERNKRVFIPSTDEELNQRWYGLSRYQIIHHEVGHALDAALHGKPAGLPGAKWFNRMSSLAQMDVRQEMIESSMRFRPKLWGLNPEYTMRDPELMADNIARWISEPDARKDMPLFAKNMGAALQPYLDMANRALPKLNDIRAGKEADTGGRSPEEEAQLKGWPIPAGGFGGQPPGPPKPPTPEGPAPEKPKKITDQTIHLSTEMLMQNVRDKFVGEPPKRTLPWLNVRTIYRQFVTELQAAHNLDDALNTPDNWLGIKDMMRQTYASRERAGYFVKHGTMDAVTGEDTGGPAMMEAFNAMREDGGNIGDFEAYRVARRVVELANRGVKFDSDEYKIAMDAAMDKGAADKYSRALDILQKNKDAVLQYGRDSGLWDDDRLAKMKAMNTEHIRFQRITNTEDAGNADTVRKGFGTRQPLKKIKGSDLKLDPNLTANDVENSHTIIAMADRNRAVNAIVMAIEATQAARKAAGEEAARPIIERAQPNVPLIGDRPLSGDLFDAAGNPIEDRTEKEAVEPFLAVRRLGGGLGKNEFMRFNNGVAEIWRAQDPETARMLRMAQPGGETTIISKIAAKQAEFERLGIVSTPDFVLRSYFRGDVEATITGAHPQPFPFHDFMSGMMDVFGMREPYLDFIRKGGEGATIADFGRDYFKDNMQDIYAASGAREAQWNLAKHPIEAMRAFKAKLLASAQVGYKKRVDAMGVDPFKSTMESREAYRDPQERAGLAAINWLDRFTPFFRMSRLDVDQAVQAFKNRPWQTAAQITTWGIAPTLLVRGLNYIQDQKHKDDPNFKKYTDYSRFERDLYYIMPSIDGVRLRIPLKPYVSGFFTSVAERAFDHFVENDPRAFKDWWQTFTAMVVPPVMPSLLMPVYEQVTNTRSYSGRPLIPASLEKVSPPFQYSPDTTDLAKHVARFLSPEYGVLATWHLGVNISPMVIDNYIREWGGTMPLMLLHLLEAATGKPPAHPWEVSDIPFVRAFIAQTPGMEAQPIQDFYDRAGEVDQARADLGITIKRRDISDIAITAANRKLGLVHAIDDTRHALGMHAKVVQAISSNTKLTDQEKLKQTNAIYAMMVIEAKNGLMLMDKVK